MTSFIRQLLDSIRYNAHVIRSEPCVEITKDDDDDDDEYRNLSSLNTTVAGMGVHTQLRRTRAGGFFETVLPDWRVSHYNRNNSCKFKLVKCNSTFLL